MTLNEWIAFGCVGMSSKTMWAALTNTIKKGNLKGFRVEIPYDKADFSRCYSLWKDCQVSNEGLQKIKNTFPIWGPFVDNWDELVSRYENNKPMFDYISSLVEQGRLLAGWVKIDDHTWKHPVA